MDMIVISQSSHKAAHNVVMQFLECAKKCIDFLFIRLHLFNSRYMVTDQVNGRKMAKQCVGWVYASQQKFVVRAETRFELLILRGHSV